MIRSVLIFFLVSLYHLGQAQIISSLSVSKDTISIGEQISVSYKLVAAKDLSIQGLNFSSLDSLESLVPTSSADTSSTPYYAEVEWEASFTSFEKKLVPYHLVQKLDQGSKYEYRDTFQATFWDLGVFELAHPHFLIDSSTLDTKILRLETPRVIVSPPNIQNADTTSVILPIKDILTTKQSFWDKYKTYFLLLGLLLISLGLFYFYMANKGKEDIAKEASIVAPKLPAHEIALEKLKNLRAQEDWKKGKVKSYQSDLTYTIREYLENRYDIKALESTTDEIIRALSQNNFDSVHEKDLKEILQIADLVKFAKAQPAEDLNEVFLDKAKSFVLETKKTHSVTETESDAG